MASQCESDSGNSCSIHLASATCITTMWCVKLASMRSLRPYRKRTEHSTVSANWKGRTCTPRVKTVSGIRNKHEEMPAFPVSCRWHETNVVCAKSGYLAVSTKMAGRSKVVVAEPITEREVVRNALQEVGEVHSTREMKDSTTFNEGRNLTLCMPVRGEGVIYSPARGYED